MHESRWWSIAVVGTAAVLASVLVTSTPSELRLNIGLSAIAVLVAAWFGLGTRTAQGSTGSTAFVAIVVLVCGTVAYAHPTLAIAQAVGFPLLWTRLDNTRRSIIGSLALAVAVGVGSFLSVGATLDAALTSVVIEGLSLVFALALGLWMTRITETSAERLRLIDELRATQKQVAMLSQDAGMMSERERLAREIHDTIAQDLTGLVLLTQRAQRELSSGDAAAVAEQLAALEDAARATLAETRALVAASTSATLVEGGIAPALERLAARYERETDMTVAVSARLGAELPREHEVVLLRCAQEGLANARKHAAATSVELSLTVSDEGTLLRVADNGTGFDTASDTHGFGLAGMRERLALVGGSLEIASGPAGTTLEVTL